MTNEEMERLAEIVTMRILNAPSGAEVVLRFPNGRAFHTMLPGVPRVGDGLWHAWPQRNSALHRFIVTKTEWWSAYPKRDVDVWLEPDQAAQPIRRADLFGPTKKRNRRRAGARGPAFDKATTDL